MSPAYARPVETLVDSKMLPPQLGGINSVDGVGMPIEDCIYCYNLLGGELGLRSRLGYKEYVTGLLGAADNTIRTMIGFTGSAKNGANDKLFAVTADGIFDVSASGVADGANFGVKKVDFAYKLSEAGYGSWTVISIPGSSRYLVYCDEENGAFLYSEASTAWSPFALHVEQGWTSLTNYIVGNKVISDGSEWISTIGGKSANTAPNGAGPAFVDGTVTWTRLGAATTGIGNVGPSLADQNLGLSGDPAGFVHVSVWKSRIFFVEKNSARAWYTDVNSAGGVLTSYDFGSKFRIGGPLVMLVNWSYDGGLGIDTELVAISQAGDISIYFGTDPSSVNTFALKGVWGVGAVPYGRRIATEHGGDVLVMSLIGVLPLSKLVISGDTENKSLYETGKISNLFNALAAVKGSLLGWSLLLQPTDNALLITFPSAENNGNTDQLAMSFATRGWARYRDLPIISACVWNRELYFGTADGRICRNTDYVDNVKLADGSSTPVKFSILTSYQSLGNARWKQVHTIRPIFLSNTVNPVISTKAKYDYDLLEPDAPTGNAVGGWDTDLWDQAVWGGDYTASLALFGATGMGRSVALAMRGQAVSRTVLTGWEITYELGGSL